VSAVNAVALLAAAGGDYQISRSVRLRASASAYFSRTPASASGQNQWTYSCWLKRSLGATQYILGGNTLTSGSTRNITSIEFNGSDALQVYAFNNSSGYYFNRVSAAVFRDPSAWYHLVVQFDPDNATSADKFIAYVNGVRLTWATSADSGVAGNTSSSAYRSINNTHRNDINGGYQGGGVPVYFGDGYQTECIMVSGSIVAHTAFGESDAVTGVWKPKKYTGTYGTNGFYLNFSDNSSNTATTIGKDYSGNGNNWTPNNISVTAGATYDSMLDTPTPYADGGNGRGNYATWNPTIAASTGVGTITNGNLQCVTPTSGASNNYGTIGMSSGKWYWEITATARTTDSHMMIGINDNTQSATEFYSQSRGYAYRGNGEKWNNGSGVSYGSAAATGDIIGVAFDADSGSLELFRNGSSMGVAFTGIAASTYFPAICDTGATVTWTATANFGQRPFAYTTPTGFKALNTQNLPDATIKKGNAYFDSSLYTGNGTSVNVTNSGAFQPDFVWLKQRSGANQHNLMDAVRGAAYRLRTDATNAEEATPGTFTFDASGFTANTTNVSYNTSGGTYVAWQWKESVTAGFDIVTYTGTGAARTVAHSLGVAPDMMIVKNRSDGTVNWRVYHKAIGATNFLSLNLTNASAAASSVWNNTAPTSSVFSVANDGGSNGSGNNMVAYLFAEVAGFSKFGSYTGNGSADGPFIYLGFKARYVLYKNASLAGTSWAVLDTARNTYNVMGNRLFAEASSAEDTSVTPFDITANGIKVRSTNDGVNRSGDTIIFAAFAENPFKNALAR
jgi:hypothetical protein